MLKNIIAPMQAWLLSQGKCVGCGRLLAKKTDAGYTQITCICGRIYMYDPSSNKYRRASFHEVK